MILKNVGTVQNMSTLEIPHEYFLHLSQSRHCGKCLWHNVKKFVALHHWNFTFFSFKVHKCELVCAPVVINQYAISSFWRYWQHILKSFGNLITPSLLGYHQSLNNVNDLTFYFLESQVFRVIFMHAIYNCSSTLQNGTLYIVSTLCRVTNSAKLLTL